MALTTYSLTGSLTDLVGDDLDIPRVVLESSQPLIPDATSGATRVGARHPVDVAVDGAVNETGIPATVGGTPLYRLHITTRQASTQAKPLTQVTGWFELTANRTVAWVVENAVQVQMVDAAVVADIQAAAALGATNDTATASFVNDTTPSATRTALLSALVSRTSRARHAPALGLYFPEAEGAVGDGVADDTAALQAALTAAAGATLHLARGVTFITDTLTVPSNTRITGGGTLRFKNNTTAFGLLDVANRTDVVVEGITLDGNRAGQTTWSESRHSLHVSGSSARVSIRGCTFLNPIGDGIYVVSNAGNIPTAVDIDGNTFVGTNANRNGVTMTACTDSRIRGNHFHQMSRDDMPGAIDLEPNAVADTISNIVIDSNTFTGGGTPTLQKAIAVNNNVGSSCTGIVISNNTIRDRFQYGIAVFGNNADKTKTQASITGNVIHGAFANTGSAAIIASSLCQVTVTGNDVDSTCEYGFKSVGSTFLVSGNKFKNCAFFGVETTGGASEVGSVVGNLFEDCGTNAAASYGAIHVKGSDLSILDNRIYSSATTKTQIGIYVETGTKNLVSGNVITGVGVRSMTCPVAPQVFGQNVSSGGFNSIGGTYPPAVGTWVAGQVIFNPNPAAGGHIGWVCTTGGTPGTWKTFGPVTV